MVSTGLQLRHLITAVFVYYRWVSEEIRYKVYKNTLINKVKFEIDFFKCLSVAFLICVVWIVTGSGTVTQYQCHLPSTVSVLSPSLPLY